MWTGTYFEKYIETQCESYRILLSADTKNLVKSTSSQNLICCEMISRNIFKLELIRVSSILCYIFGDDIIVIALFHKQIHFLLRGIELAIKWNQHHFTQVRLYWKT